MKDLIIKAYETHSLEKSEILRILNESSEDEYLFTTADKVRKEFKGDEIHLRALIEFSNICKRTCKYCGLRSENKNIERYRLSDDEILCSAENAVKYGYKTVVLQSGEDNYFSAERLAKIIQRIKKMNVAVTLSIGERTYDEYKILKSAGADRFLLRIETTDKDLYAKMHPNMNFENRKKCLYDLKSLGYETGTGCLVGLPGQTTDSLADDILFFKELDADMVGIGPFIPHKDTPLAQEAVGSFKLALKVTAITRLLLPDINIPATTAMETLNPNGRIIALQSGANVIMPNVTEDNYKSKYEIYPGKASVNGTSEENLKVLKEKLNSIGRTISSGFGFRNH